MQLFGETAYTYLLKLFFWSKNHSEDGADSHTVLRTDNMGSEAAVLWKVRIHILASLVPKVWNLGSSASQKGLAQKRPQKLSSFDPCQGQGHLPPFNSLSQRLSAPLKAECFEWLNAEQTFASTSTWRMHKTPHSILSATPEPTGHDLDLRFHKGFLPHLGKCVSL